jgi:hypothetical protein
VRGICSKEEELGHLLKEISMITETKQKLKGTKDTKNYSAIYSGVKENVRAQPGLMICIHRSLSKLVDFSNTGMIKL